jgi:hypothetical protein
MDLRIITIVTKAKYRLGNNKIFKLIEVVFSGCLKFKSRGKSLFS